MEANYYTLTDRTTTNNQHIHNLGIITCHEIQSVQKKNKLQ